MVASCIIKRKAYCYCYNTMCFFIVKWIKEKENEAADTISRYDAIDLKEQLMDVSFMEEAEERCMGNDFCPSGLRGRS